MGLVEFSLVLLDSLSNSGFGEREDIFKGVHVTRSRTSEGIADVVVLTDERAEEVEEMGLHGRQVWIGGLFLLLAASSLDVFSSLLLLPRGTVFCLLFLGRRLLWDGLRVSRHP